MYFEGRRQDLMNLLQKEGYLTVQALAKAMNVSPSSVRRDLNRLQAEGFVARSYGGAGIVNAEKSQPPFALRSHQNMDLKQKIAIRALSFIKDGDVVFLDGTSSAYAVAEYLDEFENLSVITNGVDALNLLCKKKIKVYSTGGRVSEENRSAFVGDMARKAIDAFRADVCFFSAQSLLPNGDIIDCYEAENEIRREMMDKARKSVFLCDSSKLNQPSAYYLGNVRQIEAVVSDATLENFFTITPPPVTVLA